MQSIRIDPNDHQTLKELSESTKKPMSQLISDAIEVLRRRFILEATNNGYRALQADEDAWKEELSQRSDWDGATAADANLDDWT